MRQKKLFALMVGINKYAGPVNALSGSVNDVEGFKKYIEANYSGAVELHIKTLKDSDATRDNIIRGFRGHLGKAGKDDVVLFYYSGHGSRQPSAPEFKEFFPEGVDETLVCYDSRTAGGQDLADKELAVLISEVAAHHPHIVVVMDCCHSGSITREEGNPRVKKTVGRQVSKPLAEYLDGWYAQRYAGNPLNLNIPTSPHVLLAACKREQVAWEVDGQGAFTRALLEVLEKKGTLINYADLFIGCRSVVNKRIQNQMPQFESYGGFNAYTAFLDGATIGKTQNCTVFFENNAWKMNMGALHGIPTDPKQVSKLTIYKKDSPDILGHAETIAVNAQVSTLKLDFTGDTNTQYKAEIRYFPVSPLTVYIEGDESGKKQLEKALEYFPNIVFVDMQKQAHYRISALDNRYLLSHIDSGQLIEGVKGYSEKSAQYILSDVEHIRRWEYNLEIQNNATKFDINKDVEFRLVEIIEGKEYEYTREEITLDFKKENGDWCDISVKIQAKNNTDRKLNFALFHFSRQFGIHVGINDPVPPKSGFVTLWGVGAMADMDQSIYLPDGVDEAVDTYKLIVSTEKVDSFLVEQEDLKLGEIIMSAKNRDSKVVKKVTDDWFTKVIRVKTVRQHENEIVL